MKNHDQDQPEPSEAERLRALETATGKELSPDDRTAIVRPVDELTVVNSGLEQTMIDSYHQLQETAKRVDGIADLRTAGYYLAIERVAHSYTDLGVFP